MLRKVKLYGELAKFIGHKELEVKAETVGKAISFLIHNFPEVESYMSPKHYQVKVGDYAVDETEILHPIGQEDIHFVPVITGAGRGFGKILLGAALIGIAFLMPVASGGLSLGAGIKAGSLAKVGFMTKMVAGVGASLVLSGVSDMLFPLPDVPAFEDTQDPRLSFSFGGTQQTGRAGTPVPLVFGEIFTGSVVISGSIDTEQVQA